MCKIINFKQKNKKKIIGENCGNILVSVYKSRDLNNYLFYIKPENEEVMEIADMIEKVLKLY